MKRDWEIIDQKLVKSFDFQDFVKALKFINEVGAVAENMNHHPKIINVYNTITFELWTHDQNTISNLDYDLAEAIDKLFGCT